MIEKARTGFPVINQIVIFTADENYRTYWRNKLVIDT
jgi:hypothetical protein